ncbi:MAG: tetratricopeptide repeat protein [Gammaproteobacteria bacterium]|nr:tetratricopeptide repeat protein [Gammaproteobacteria bacterium]
MMSEQNNLELEQARQAYTQGDFKKARDIWETQAEAGTAEAQAWLGSMYANGDGVDVDNTTALAWYEKAAHQNHAMAQANVGAMYFMGQGSEKNVSSAIKWLKAAADNNDVNGLFNLAVIYSKGEDVDEDQEQAAELYRKAAEQGHYPSQSRLGYMYAHGQGVEKDRILAYLWLTLASQHGIGTALAALETVVKSMSSEEKAMGATLVEQWRNKTGSDRMQVALNPTPSN